MAEHGSDTGVVRHQGLERASAVLASIFTRIDKGYRYYHQLARSDTSGLLVWEEERARKTGASAHSDETRAREGEEETA